MFGVSIHGFPLTAISVAWSSVMTKTMFGRFWAEATRTAENKVKSVRIGYNPSSCLPSNPFVSQRSRSL